MRRWFVAFCLLSFTSQASAGDFDVPTLRGSSPFIPAPAEYPRWGGFYVGGQVGHSSAVMNFAGATESLIAYMLRTTALENEQRPSEWDVLGKGHASSSNVGGFIGYNTQWQDAVVGIDVHYNRSNFFSDAPVTPITRMTSAGGNAYYVNVTGDASMKIVDYGAARLRGGWTVGSLLPYATIGLAVGRADITRSARVSGAENPPSGYPVAACDPFAGCTRFSFSHSESAKAAFIYGWSAGLGLDVMLTDNLFVRGEYESLQFAKFQGIDVRINNVRVGAGAKF
jgi:outer membrane immunogenic protein